LNCGVEGPTDDERVNALRERQKRNFIATLFLSQGVPMLRGGDELSQTQGGNNNAYCQDNEISWLDWTLTPQQEEFLEFMRQAIALRLSEPVLHRRRFFQGRGLRGAGVQDISWIDASGTEMTDETWNLGFVKSLGVRLAGDLIDERDERGERIAGGTLLLLLNANGEAVPFKLPPLPAGCFWEECIDSANGRHLPLRQFRGGQTLSLEGRSTLVLLQRREKRRRQTDRLRKDVESLEREPAAAGSRADKSHASAPSTR